ncbi:MAG: hypothetical protein AAF383_24225 [Cyanobacteria bacterium P01_A01_bin.83]
MMNIKNFAVPAFVALSLAVTACGGENIEAPDAVDGGESIEQNLEDAGNAVEDAAGAAQDDLNEGLDEAGNAVKELGE